MSEYNESKRNASKGMKFGLLIFLVIFAYIVAALFNYFSQKHVESYQVKMGSLSSNNVFKAMALRDEIIVRAQKAGYINYFARETQRVGVGNMVYTLDESGKVSEYFNTDEGTSDLTTKDLTELKTDILSFINEFEPTNFLSVYDFKFNVEGTVLKLSSANILSDIEKINDSGVSNLVSFNYAPTSGYVIYSVDGYEDLSVNDVTKELIDYKNYETDGKKKQLISNNLVGDGDPVYKLATNEDWSVVFSTDADQAAELLEEKYVLVKFLKNQNTAWGKVSTYVNDANDTFVKLDFTNSMMTFCTDRFIDIELILDDDKGLKVPNSSIVDKMFYLVPKEYITKGNNTNSTGVLREYYLEDGSKSSEFIEVTIYGETEDGEYYLDDLSLRDNDTLIMPDSTSTFTVAKKGNLTGVYNINKGYADFKRISILYQNDEYSIIEPNLLYSLNAYDYIVLDANTVNKDELIYD